MNVNLNESVIKLENGLIYKGNTFNGKAEGFGTLTKKGNIVYQGQFLNGAYHGQGYLSSGTKKYRGEFLQG